LEAKGRLDNLNFIENMGNGEITQKLLSAALEIIVFQFIKVGEEKLKLSD
jgi:type I restriction enzyme, R subunit